MTTMLAASGGAVQIDLLVVLACAGLVSLFLSRFRVAVIPAYLLTGMVIGPSGLGIVSSPERVEQLGELALIVLMFSIGMHLDSSSLRRGAVSIISIGLVSTLTATGLIAGALAATPLHTSAAIAIGMALAMSSTAVVLQLLTQRRKLQTTTGRASLGVLLTQDLLAIVYLAVMPVIAHAYGLGVTAEESKDATARIGRLAMAIGGVSALIVVGRLVLPRLLREASRVGGSEVMLVLTAAVGLGAATLTAGLGLSAELGRVHRRVSPGGHAVPVSVVRPVGAGPGPVHGRVLHGGGFAGRPGRGAADVVGGAGGGGRLDPAQGREHRGGCVGGGGRERSGRASGRRPVAGRRVLVGGPGHRR
jgi:predicted Kef-type K+ transport protein